jgi:16S rRNA G527 N7-methylase RsmG
MSENKQMEYVKKWSQDSKLPDIKIHNGEAKEKTKAGKWEYI